MKNVLFIVIDSVTNDIIFNKPNSKEIAPFLNDLRKKSISGDKMYSEAPFTEAALMALLGSTDTMDAGGYMEKMKNTSCVLEYFQKENYKVFFDNYYPSVYPSYMVKGYDEVRYIEGFNIYQLWDYRFQYYADIYLQDKTTEKENIMLKDMLEDNLIAWIKYLEKIKNNDIETTMLNDNINKDSVDSDLIKIKNEYEMFKKDSDTYLKELFIQKENHQLFRIETYKMTDKIHNDEIRNIVVKKYKNIFNKIAKLDFERNLLNNKYPFNKTLKSLFKGDFRTVKGLIAGYKNSLFDKDLYERINDKFDLFKGQRSFYTVSNELINWIDKNSDQKWMSYVHIDDAHFPEQFFTYDTDNLSIIDGDFERIDKYLDSIPKDYKGNIAYDLSLNYCDNVIKNIFKYLEEKKLLDNTSVVITADHGNSYYFCPVREKYVISNYKENYNVPFIVYSKDIKPRMIPGYCSTKDIPATLLSLANINIPSNYKGKNLLKYDGSNYSLLEYMGGGCPDISRRPIKLGVKTDNYSITMNAYLNKDFEDNSIEEIYDLKNDPFENNDLKDKLDVQLKLKNELKILKTRFNELKKQYNNGEKYD